MLGALSRKGTPLATCGAAALRQHNELISSLLAKTRDFSNSSSRSSNVSDSELQNAAITAIYEHVPVGSRLELELGSQPVQVLTEIGTSPEIVKLYAWTTSTDSHDVNTTTTENKPVLEYGIRNNENNASTIWASLLEQPTANKIVASSITTTPAPTRISKLLAVVPSRYFSFNIETGGGSVDVAASKEASLISIKTHGGAITGGSLQASHISLLSGGGTISMKQLTASEIKIASNGGNIAVNTLAGLNINVDGGEDAGEVKIGACFVEEQGDFSCGKFIAESVRGGTDGSGSIHVKLVAKFNNSCTSKGAKEQIADLGTSPSKATIGGVDGALQISCNQGPAVIDLQINEGCRDVMIDTSMRGNTTTPVASTVALHVAPTLAAHVVLNECGKDWMLPSGTHAVLGKETTRNIYAQLEIENDEQLGPRSRLQRGSNDSLGGEAVAGVMPPCTLAVRGAGRVRVQRRSWMQARQEAFRLKQM